MRWDLQLATGMTAGEGHLLGGARQARERVRLHRYGEATEILWELLLALPRGREGRQRAFLLIHLGHVYRNWMIEVAFKFFRDARDLSRDTKFTRGEMVAECSLGVVYLDWNEHERALVHYERALRMAWACAGVCWQRDVLAAVIECMQALGHTEGARRMRDQLDQLQRRIDEDLWGPPPEERLPRAPAPLRCRRREAGKGETTCWS